MRWPAVDCFVSPCRVVPLRFDRAVNTKKKNLKLDAINRKILTITHTRANISNQELAQLVGLSNSACFQRVRALKESGYFLSFNTDLV